MADMSVKITDNSSIKINDGSTIKIREDSALNVLKVQNIAPVATHIKEINHIDPILVDAFHVNEIKNIEPIRIEKFSVTNLPTVNMSVRQLPSVDLNIRRLPAVSVGTHQEFCVPSSYTLRARFLGIEFFRIHLDGQTSIIPQERFRREQGRTQNRSFPVTATAGNPAIPSICHETSTESCAPSLIHDHQPVEPHTQSPSHPASRPRGVGFRPTAFVLQAEAGGPSAAGGNHGPYHQGNRREGSDWSRGVEPGKAVSFGMPGMHFHIPESETDTTLSESCVSSGE